jgi:hypothetical protein
LNIRLKAKIHPISILKSTVSTLPIGEVLMRLFARWRCGDAASGLLSSVDVLATILGDRELELNLV